jgi:hypothetical protein
MWLINFALKFAARGVVYFLLQIPVVLLFCYNPYWGAVIWLLLYLNIWRPVFTSAIDAIKTIRENRKERAKT